MIFLKRKKTGWCNFLGITLIISPEIIWCNRRSRQCKHDTYQFLKNEMGKYNPISLSGAVLRVLFRKRDRGEFFCAKLGEFHEKLCEVALWQTNNRSEGAQ